MLIGGRHVDIDMSDLDAVVSTLNKLSTGFPRRNLKITKPDFGSSGNEANRYHKRGAEAYQRWNKTNNPDDLDEALQSFLCSAQESGKKGYLSAQACSLYNYGSLCRMAGISEQGIPMLEDALSLEKREGNCDRLLTNVGELYAAICDTIIEKERKKMTQEAVLLKDKLASLGRMAVDFISRDRGESVNPKAYRVEQAEIGFSDKEPIGTDNIRNCVCVIVRDPETHKTALAHVDAKTDISSLQQIFDQMPKGKTLDVKLVGAVYGAESNVKGAKSSRENLDGVMRFLGTKDVNIVSADVFNKNQPSAVVVDPETFELFEEVPGVSNPDKSLVAGKCWADSWGRPLHVAFDLTVSKDRAPVLLSSEVVRNLRGRYRLQDEYEIACWYRDHTFISKKQLPASVECLSQVSQAYKKSVGYVLDALDQKIVELENRGVHLDWSQRDKAVLGIRKHEIYVGHGAKEANQPLIDFINNDLFVTECVYGAVQEMGTSVVPG
jgi:chemotaxis receptor (MCP) glutamine deamidase CheD